MNTNKQLLSSYIGTALIIFCSATLTVGCQTKVMQTKAEDITIKVKRHGLQKKKWAAKAQGQALDHCRKNGFAKAMEVNSYNDRQYKVVNYKCQ